MSLNIGNASQLIEKFGYWPDFCDARLEKLSLDLQSQSILISLDHIDKDKKLMSKIDLEFNDVGAIELQDLLDENILDKLSINQIDAEKYEIRMQACYGINGCFNCGSVEVKGVY